MNKHKGMKRATWVLSVVFGILHYPLLTHAFKHNDSVLHGYAKLYEQLGEFLFGFLPQQLGTVVWIPSIIGTGMLYAWILYWCVVWIMRGFDDDSKSKGSELED